MRRENNVMLPVLACLALARSLALAAEPAGNAPPGLKVKDGDVIVTCGDSITCGPYPVYVAIYLRACCGAKVQVDNCAMYGQDTPYLLKHLESDVLPYKPTVATICMEMNSAGKGAPLIRPDGDKTKAKLVAATEAVIERFKAAGVRTVFLGSSSPTDTDTMRYRKPTDEDSPAGIACNQSLALLRDAYQGVAHGKPEVVWVSVFDDFMAAMAKAKKKYGRTYHVAGEDGVHPGRNGHLCIAYSFLRAMGCDGNIGTIAVDLAAGTAEVSEGHKVLSSGGGTVQVESSRYPFCFYPDKDGGCDSPENPMSIRAGLPFDRDLNRFTLVVKGATAGKYQVTWGTESRVFAGEELAKGVNLAEAFVGQTPFQEAFKRFNTELGKRQRGFGDAHKAMLKWDGKSPKTEKHEAADAYLAQSEAALANALQPVKHAIQVKPAAD